MEGTAGAAAAIIERAPWQPGSHRESRGGPSSLPGPIPRRRARAGKFPYHWPNDVSR